MATVELLQNEIFELYTLLDKYKITIQPTDLAMYQMLNPTLLNLKEAVEIAMDSKELNINRFTSDQEKALQELLVEVSGIRNKAQDPMVLSVLSSTETVLSYLEGLVVQLKAAEVLKAKYDSWSELFRNGGGALSTLETSTVSKAINLQSKLLKDDEAELDILDETRNEIHMKRTLWTSLRNWEVITNEWKVLNFEKLSTEDVNQKIIEYLKIVYSLDKGLPPNDVVPKLKLKIEQYRNIYNTIVDLKNPSLKVRHWDRIQEATGKTIVRDEAFTLLKLMENFVFDFKSEISNISAQASSEASLEEMLSKVNKAWSETEFIVTPYRDNKDVFILGSIEDIQTLLEDSQITIATIRCSRFIGPIKSEVERWEKTLFLFAETLNEWMACQRSWLYLESIFSSPDIQRQLPDESRMFSHVDRAWKDMMRKTSRSPNALKSGTVPGYLEILKQNNQSLENIQKCLEDYLESKRLLFPRFYFLSNDELLEILSQSKNPQAVQPHLSKCFDAIKTLEFLSNDPKSIDIVAMISPEGERVPFLKTIKARGNVETWLSSVEEAMIAVLRKMIKNSIFDYDEARRSDWVRDHFGQVVLTANQVLWTRDVSESLKSSDANKGLSSLRQANLKVKAFINIELK